MGASTDDNGLKNEAAYLGCEVKSGITGGSYCFVAGTMVHTEKGILPIEDVAPGDYVLAYNEETGENGYKQVLHLFHNTTEELDTPVATYNFEVEDWHTYYVTDAGVLVHNNNCPKLTNDVSVNKTTAVNEW